MPVDGAGVRTARYAAVFLVMLSNLMFELLLTRIFSATMWYHFAFMAVSIALFGTAVGAVIVHWWPPRLTAELAWHAVAVAGLAYAVSIVLCTMALLRFNVSFGATWQQLTTMTILYVVTAIPFILSGLFVCVALVRAEARVGAMYGADLIGAGMGCVLFVPFMAAADGPRGVLLLAAVAAVGAALMAWSTAARRTAALGMLTAALCLVAFTAHLDRRALHVHWAKGYWARDHLLERWNAFSRLAVDESGDHPFTWGLGGRFVDDGSGVDQDMLSIDAAAATPLTRFDGDFETLRHLKWDVTALAHALPGRRSVLVIGVGGGRDILTALAFGRRVVGVEVNGDIIQLLRGPFADFTGRLAFRPDVQLIHDEARSYVVHTPERFDIIQAALVDTWAAAANGAYALSENALYTKEAFRRFLDHLTPGGMLSLSRWYNDAQPGETLRLVSLAATALRARGNADPRAHLFLARSPRPGVSVATLLIAQQPFARDDVDALRRWCAEKGFEELLSPGLSRTGILAQLAEPEEPSALLRTYPIDLRAPTDDRPFFFNMLRLRDAFTADLRHSDLIQANAEAVITLAWLLVIVVSLSAVFIIAPLWFRRADGRGAPRLTSRLVYFGGLGLGFMLIELSQMQRLTVVLGHPVYGLTVVLFVLLLAAGMGGLWTQRAARQGLRSDWLLRMLALLLICAVATGLVGGIAAHALEPAPLWARVGGSVCLLFPLGFLLGVPLPTGMALSVTDAPEDRALYWGVNGATSVCGSVLATMLALGLGITATYTAGVLAYGLAGLAAAVTFRR